MRLLPVAIFSLAMSWATISSAQDLPNLAKNNDVVTGIAVSSSGGCYVVGYSKGEGSGYDFLTLKYSSGGSLEWSRRYDGGGKLDDKPSAIALDAAGNAYVAGGSSDSATGRDYLTLKYSPTGDLLWAKKFNGAGNGYDRATAMAVDAAGDVVVTGFSYGQGKDYDAVTVEYDTRGVQLWAKTYSGESKGEDYGGAVCFDGSGNVLVAGYSQRAKQSANYFLLKYSSKGDQLWERIYSDQKFKSAKATSLTLTPSGIACISGTAVGSHGEPNILSVAYDPDGKQVWTNVFDGRTGSGSKSSGLASLPSDAILVFGAVMGDSGSDFVTFQVSGQGKTLWESRYNGSGNGDDIPTSAKTTLDGSSVVTGYSLGSIGGSDIVTVKYDALGKQVWEQRYNGAANDVDRPAGLGIDSVGSVYVAGSSWGGKQNGFDFVTIKYSSDGKLVWIHRFDGHLDAISASN